MKRTLRPLAVGGALLVLAGCTVGPEPRRPQTVADDAETFVHASPGIAPEPAAAVGSSEPGSIAPWWEVLGDPATEELVALALERNTDLQEAAARVLEARAEFGRSRASRFPELTAGAGAGRSKSSFILPQSGRVEVEATTYSTDLNVAYQLDLFGKLKRTRQASWAQLLAQEAARDTVLHTVVSEVVRLRVRLSVLGRGAEVARDIRNSREQTLETVDRRYDSGLVDALDLRLARENLAAAEANVVQLEQQLAQARLALDVLVGRRPGTGSGPDALLAPLPNLDPVPLGLPADLLDRRPDLRAAEMQLAAGTYRVGVAVADLFPGLSLTGAVGSRSDTLSELVSSDALVWNALAGLLGPIFDGGRRRGAVRAAEARMDQAAASYAGAVLRALREVEDALVRDAAGRERLAFLETRLDEAQAADRIARERWLRGVVPLLQVLETERRLRIAEEAVVAAQGDLWNSRIDLHLALGGDWGTLPASPTTAHPPQEEAP